MTTREMLDKMASQNYQMAIENTRFKNEVTALREALLDCHQNLPQSGRKNLQPKTLEILERLAPQTARARSKAAAQA